MDPNEVMQQARDALTVKRVFGDPYERNGVTRDPGRVDLWWRRWRRWRRQHARR